MRSDCKRSNLEIPVETTATPKSKIGNRKSEIGNAVGLTGLEPVTLRLSSACSNQLSYRPVSAAEPPDFRFAIVDFRFGITGAQARIFKI
jgi:hypothetical protein